MDVVDTLRSDDASLGMFAFPELEVCWCVLQVSISRVLHRWRLRGRASCAGSAAARESATRTLSAPLPAPPASTTRAPDPRVGPIPPAPAPAPAPAQFYRRLLIHWHGQLRSTWSRDDADALSEALPIGRGLTRHRYIANPKCCGFDREALSRANYASLLLCRVPACSALYMHARASLHAFGVGAAKASHFGLE